MSDAVQTSKLAGHWWQADETELIAALTEREQQIRRLQAEQAAVIAEIDQRGPMPKYGYASTPKLLQDVLHIARRDAQARVERATACHATRGIGTMIPAAAPVVAEAAADGAIGTGHIDVLLEVLDGIPDEIPAEERLGYEKTLVTLARQAPPEAVRKVGRFLLARLDQDGNPPDDAEQANPDRELNLGWRRDGKLGLKGYLDAETGQFLLSALSPLSKPRPAQDGTPDPRTAAERNGDALAELIKLAHDATDKPAEGGQQATVIVTLDYNRLLGDLSSANSAGLLDGLAAGALLNGEQPLTGEQVRRLACDAQIIPAVLGTTSEQLDLGRSERLISRAQRRMLNLRDKGCVFPGCTRPPRWTQGHHIIHWLDLGPTDLSNLCLLCAEHHRLVHHSDWRIFMAADGHPECIPPAYIDPERKPRRNHAHDAI